MDARGQPGVPQAETMFDQLGHVLTSLITAAPVEAKGSAEMSSVITSMPR